MEPKNTKETKKRTKVPTSFDSQFFPGKARKEEPDVSTLADAAIGEDALEAFRLYVSTTQHIPTLLGLFCILQFQFISGLCMRILRPCKIWL